MPTITLSKKELLASVGKHLADDELKDRISMLGTDLESIEGDEIHVEIFPNRPDLLSQQGFARAFSTFVGTAHGLKKYDVHASGEKVIIDKSVEKCRPFTACAIVRDLEITEQKLKEIIQIQEKLHVTFCRNRKRAAIGIYPMEHITFPIHFKGMKPEEIKFRPLEAHGEMTAEEILTEHPKGKDFAGLLDGLERYACFVDAKGHVMSLTPIINSHLTGKISESTKDVFVECSGFDQRILNECLAMTVCALADMGGAIESLELHYPHKTIVTPNLAPHTMEVDREYLNQLLGLDLKDADLKKLLEKMGFGYEKGHAHIPAYRTDILHQADLAEDVAIAYGYENVAEVIPNVATVAQELPFEVFCAKVRVLLVGHGLLEAKSYNLINKEAQTTRMRHEADVIALASAVSSEYDTLRSWIMPSLMETLARNRRHEYPQSFFEIGRVFTKAKDAKKTQSGTGVSEKVRLAVVLCGEDADYTRIRQILDDTLAKLGIAAKYEATVHASFIPGRVARVHLTDEKKEEKLDGVAYIGELHPEVLANFGLTMPAACFELDLTATFNALQK